MLIDEWKLTISSAELNYNFIIMHLTFGAVELLLLYINIYIQKKCIFQLILEEKNEDKNIVEEGYLIILKMWSYYINCVVYSVTQEKPDFMYYY